MAVHHGSDGTALVDALLDNAGLPEGIDLAWRTKHFLGAPVPGATMAAVNLAHIVTAVEFVAAELAEPFREAAGGLGEELPSKVTGLGLLPDLAIVATE